MSEIKLEVGQVWSNKSRTRTIIYIRPGGVVFFGGQTRAGAVSEKTFKAWIARTGAKLEGRDGE